MGKKSEFERNPRDYYITPKPPVISLLPHLNKEKSFDEPCAGNGALAQILMNFGFVCKAVSDIEPQNPHIVQGNALDLNTVVGDIFITNPPWPALGQQGDPTISLALHLSSIAPTWLLLSSDFAHNKYFAKVAGRCIKIVSVGRVKWIPDSDGPGKDNCAWYLFDKDNTEPTIFIGR